MPLDDHITIESTDMLSLINAPWLRNLQRLQLHIVPGQEKNFLQLVQRGSFDSLKNLYFVTSNHIPKPFYHLMLAAGMGRFKALECLDTSNHYDEDRPNFLEVRLNILIDAWRGAFAVEDFVNDLWVDESDAED